MNTIVIGTINHSYWSYVHQLNAIERGLHFFWPNFEKSFVFLAENVAETKLSESSSRKTRPAEPGVVFSFLPLGRPARDMGCSPLLLWWTIGFFADFLEGTVEKGSQLGKSAVGAFNDPKKDSLPAMKKARIDWSNGANRTELRLRWARRPAVQNGTDPQPSIMPKANAKVFKTRNVTVFHCIPFH